MFEMKSVRSKWIVSIPYNWNLKRLKYCVKEMCSGGTPETADNLYYDDENGIPWVAISDMSSCDYIENTSKKVTKEGMRSKRLKVFPKGTLLYSIFATIGKVSILNVNATFNQALLAIVPQKILDNSYLKFCLKGMEEYVLSESSTNTQSNLNSTKVNNFVIPLPNIKEQRLIADFLNEKVDIIDNIICGLDNQIEILNKYKKQLISEVAIKGLNKKVAMKDSGVEWIGSIPEHWNIKLIKNICSLKGRIGWEGLTKDEYISEGPTLITGINFDNGSINWDSCEHVSDWRYNQDKSIQIKNKDLLITKDGTVGKVAIVKDCPEKVTLNSGVLLLRPLSNEYVEKYLYYVLLSNEFWHWFEIENIGNTTIIHLYQNRFAKFKLALPPINEQKEIVNYLDKKCSEIEELLNSKIQQKEQMEQYKKSVIYEYVTGKKRLEGAEELYG